MLPLPLACLLQLAAPALGEENRAAPRLEVLEGTVRVLAGETWLGLERGSELPESRARATLSLDWNVRARLTIAGAGVELRGPLEVESTMDSEWTLRVDGRGAAQLSARSATVHVELASTARLDLNRGVYWIEGLTQGGWRVGCDAGEPLCLRPPRGSGWEHAPRIESGASLRVVPAAVVPPAAARAGHRLAAPAWKSFSWPWPSPNAE